MLRKYVETREVKGKLMSRNLVWKETKVEDVPAFFIFGFFFTRHSNHEPHAYNFFWWKCIKDKWESYERRSGVV